RARSYKGTGQVVIELEIVLEDARWQDFDTESILEQSVTSLTAERPEGLRAGEISLLFTSDAAVQVLNRDWRGKDRPTNVLSFPAEDFPALEGVPTPLGDIALAYETCVREATEKEISVEDHLAHLILHGILHLLGYDHLMDEDAAEMEGLERRLLARLGIADPYGLADNGESDA
ncbi:MAG: rRNA maturation RNase YbeY, partial [Pseudomonadota bacterium]